LRKTTKFDLKSKSTKKICNSSTLLLAKLLSAAARNIDELNVDQFYNPHPNIGNPLRERIECRLACDRLLSAAQENESILLYGDYDCDGVVSITLLHDALLAIGVKASRIHILIPHRVRDGYGFKWDVCKQYIKRIEDDNDIAIRLVVTLDCGTTADKEVNSLLNEDIEVMVVDHHTPNLTHPLPQRKGLIHLNPKNWLNDEQSEGAWEMKEMCAAGLTYLLAEALSDKTNTWSRDRGLLLAGLATCVDVVSMVGINRTLTKLSLSLANQEDKLALVPGLVALRRIAGPPPKQGRPITEHTYGFQWGPQLNAPGRMADAIFALKLLISQNEEEARHWASLCAKNNMWRKATERTILESAYRRAALEVHRNKPNVLLLCNTEWHPGVVGIVASRIREAFSRPTILCSMHSNNHWKGSGRSMQKCDMGQMLHQAKGKNLITEGGGHPMAGGMEFSEDQRKELQTFLNSQSQLDESDLVPVVNVLAPASALSPRLWVQAFDKLAPFGNGNPFPDLVVEAGHLLGVRVRTRMDRVQKYEILERANEIANNDKRDELSILPSTSFVPDDVTGLKGFAECLSRENTDPVSTFLWEHFDIATRNILLEWKSWPPDIAEIIRVVVNNLNRLAMLRLVYTEERFKLVELRYKTKQLITVKSQGKTLFGLNRLLLEDAYPLYLRKNPKIGQNHMNPPKVWSYEGTFMDKITNMPVIAHWLDLEQAELLWQTHHFMSASASGNVFELPYFFRLKLELRAFVPTDQWPYVQRGEQFHWDYSFQIVECVELGNKSRRNQRMPVLEQKRHEVAR
jgi:single-stranded-DNA-specific exonuclease